MRRFFAFCLLLSAFWLLRPALVALAFALLPVAVAAGAVVVVMAAAAACARLTAWGWRGWGVVIVPIQARPEAICLEQAPVRLREIPVNGGESVITILDDLDQHEHAWREALVALLDHARRAGSLTSEALVGRAVARPAGWVVLTDWLARARLVEKRNGQATTLAIGGSYESAIECLETSQLLDLPDGAPPRIAPAPAGETIIEAKSR